MKLTEKFYKQDALTVSESLIGKVLNIRRNGQINQYIIVETEAYCGLTDQACHAYFKKKTKRTKTMFLTGGHLYVYLIYGMYHCLNVVTNNEDVPQAVLIRAVEPLNHSIQYKKYMKTNGPGKLCKALGIDLTYNERQLITDKDIFITDDLKQSFQIEASKRINIDYAGEAVHFPWRFTMKGNKFVSK